MYRSPLGYIKTPRPALRRHNETMDKAVLVNATGGTVAAVLVEVAVVCRASRLSKHASEHDGKPSSACKTYWQGIDLPCIFPLCHSPEYFSPESQNERQIRAEF